MIGSAAHLMPIGVTGKSPGALGFLRALAGDFAFCRFCHFRVLTAKTSPPITRLVADEPARRAPAATTTERADVLPGNRKQISVPKNSEATASNDAAL